MSYLYRKKLLMLCGDVLIIAAVLYFVPFVHDQIPPETKSILGLEVIVTLLVYLFVMYLFDFYHIGPRIRKVTWTVKLILAVGVATSVNAALFYLMHLRPYGSWLLLIIGLLILITLALWRLAFVYLAHAAIKPSRLIIFGAGECGKEMYRLLRFISDYQVIGFIDDDPAIRDSKVDGLAVLGVSNQILDVIDKYNIQKVIVCADAHVPADVFPVLVAAKFRGVSVYEMPTFYEKIANKIPVAHISHVWLGYADIGGVKKNIYNIKVKDVIDKTLAVVGLVMATPVLIIVSLCIKLESRGPVIYKQTRVGLDETIFFVHKFRSMVTDAEENGVVWARKDDPRITRVGRWLRFWRIDELPQLWDVLRGEMSFVGPRPERPQFVKRLEKEIPYYMLRHVVKPGITGWAQINYPYGDSTEDALEKLKFDLYYIKNKTFLLDVYIMFRTLRVVISGKGAR